MSHDLTPNDQLWTMADVADYVRVSPHTIRKWRESREGPPALIVGGSLRYQPDAVRAWAAAQTEAGSR